MNPNRRPLFLASLAAGLLAAAPIAAQDGDYTFFVGTDIAVFHQTEAYPVSGFDNDTFLLETEGGALLLPVRKAEAMITERNPKISAETAVLSDLVVNQSYSAENDPRLAWQSTAYALQEHALNEQDRIRAEVIANAQATAIAGGNASEVFQEGMADIEASIQASEQVGDMASDVPTTLAGAFDAIEMSFQLSGIDDLVSPYVVALVRFADPETGREFVRPIFQSVPAPLPENKRVRLYAAGFPYDYHLVETKLALFDQGREIATNLSEKRVPVTREQALLYLRFERKNEYPGSDLPPAPIPGFTPIGFASSLSSDLAQRSVALDIDAKGNVTRLAPSGLSDLPPDIAAMIESLPFYPALQAGQPVEGQLVATVGELLR